jgi:hypothetical protein
MYSTSTATRSGFEVERFGQAKRRIPEAFETAYQSAREPYDFK